MKLLFTNNTHHILKEKTMQLINYAILETLHYENVTQNVEISLVIVSNEEIKKINNQYRKINKETDVLSFPMLNQLDIKNSLHTLILGDIIISMDKVIYQAIQYNHSQEREICFLIVHSMLHLLGYDHIQPQDEVKMIRKQDEILKNINVHRE